MIINESTKPEDFCSLRGEDLREASDGANPGTNIFIISCYINHVHALIRPMQLLVTQS